LDQPGRCEVVLGMPEPTLGPAHHKRVQTVDRACKPRLARLLIEELIDQRVEMVADVLREVSQQLIRRLELSLGLRSLQLRVPERRIAGVDLDQVVDNEQSAHPAVIGALWS